MKRYDFWTSDGRPVYGDETGDGAWVRYEDAESWGAGAYQKLLDRFEAQQKELLHLQLKLDNVTRSRDEYHEAYWALKNGGHGPQCSCGRCNAQRAVHTL